jgi:hypothetical protein
VETEHFTERPQAELLLSRESSLLYVDTQQIALLMNVLLTVLQQFRELERSLEVLSHAQRLLEEIALAKLQRATKRLETSQKPSSPLLSTKAEALPPTKDDASGDSGDDPAAGIAPDSASAGARLERKQAQRMLQAVVQKREMVRQVLEEFMNGVQQPIVSALAKHMESVRTRCSEIRDVVNRIMEPAAPWGIATAASGMMEENEVLYDDGAEVEDEFSSTDHLWHYDEDAPGWWFWDLDLEGWVWWGEIVEEEDTAEYGAEDAWRRTPTADSSSQSDYVGTQQLTLHALVEHTTMDADTLISELNANGTWQYQWYSDGSGGWEWAGSADHRDSQPVVSTIESPRAQQDAPNPFGYTSPAHSTPRSQLTPRSHATPGSQTPRTPRSQLTPGSQMTPRTPRSQLTPRSYERSLLTPGTASLSLSPSSIHSPRMWNISPMGGGAGRAQSEDGDVEECDNLLVRALADYRARDPSELQFYESDIITVSMVPVLAHAFIIPSPPLFPQVHVKDPSGWWHGECNGKDGWFPSNYVHVQHDLWTIMEVDTPRSESSDAWYNHSANVTPRYTPRLEEIEDAEQDHSWEPEE